MRHVKKGADVLTSVHLSPPEPCTRYCCPPLVSSKYVVHACVVLLLQFNEAATALDSFSVELHELVSTSAGSGYIVHTNTAQPRGAGTNEPAVHGHPNAIR